MGEQEEGSIGNSPRQGETATKRECGELASVCVLAVLWRKRRVQTSSPSSVSSTESILIISNTDVGVGDSPQF